MAIVPVQVQYQYSSVRKEKVEVCRLYPDGFLYLKEDPEVWIRSNPADHLSVRFLELSLGHGVEKIGDSIGTLSQLTHLYIYWGDFKCLPNSISSLHNLQRLELFYCLELQELPADLGDLKSLTYLSLCHCFSIKSLPNSIANLSNLTTLRLLCDELEELPANVGDLESLTFLSLKYCHSIKSLPNSIANLSKLLVLNIQDTAIKWLPWSITKLSKLRLLILSESFRLETLPKQLNDSVVISVENKHIRKTWEELKTEIELFSIPIVGVEATHSPSTPGYLQYTADPGPWIQSNCLHSLVRILDLELHHHVFDWNIINSIGKLPELTHLYISNGNLHNLPLTITRLTHLSLFYCDFESCCDSLGKLSTLESLTLIQCTDLPAQMDLPGSLTHFALESYEYESLPDSMRKLSNLNTLELSGFGDLELSLLNLNLANLKIRDGAIKSLPRGLQHLEIMHSRDWCAGCSDNKLQECFNPLVNLETLSITCYDIKVLPSIVRHQTLQELQLKDCFNLRKLPPNLDELVELRTLNVSGTRIKSLPHSITKLQNLRHLILPKCFKLESLPKNFEDKVRVSIDDTDDMYYQDAGYYDPAYYFWEDNEITSWSIEGGDEVVSQESRNDIIIEQPSPHRPLNPLPDATQVHKGSHFSSRTVPIDYAFSSSQNLEMEILSTVYKDCVVPLAPNNISDYNVTDEHNFSNKIRQVHHADPEELEDSSFNGRIDVVDESSSHALCNLQNQVLETWDLRNSDCVGNFSNDLAAKSSSNIHETNCFGESNQQGIQNGRMDTISLEYEKRNPPCDSINYVHGGSNYNGLEDGQDKNPQSVDLKHEKTQKIDITKERILQCRSENMTIPLAAKHLKVHASTLKRRLREFNITWSENKKMKQHKDGKNKEHNTGSHCERNSSQLNLVDPSTLAGHDNRAEHIEGSCRTFDVKATYKGDIVRIYKLSLSSSIDQLKEKVGEKLGLEVGKFKMKFLDEDNDWILMSCISDLEHALRLSKSSGISVVKLSVIPQT